MFLVMGFTGKKAAAIKEAYINAFDRMAEQLKVISSTPPSQQHQLTTFSRLPNYYESGWIPALYRRCQIETHWTYHIKFSVRPTGDRFSVLFKYGVGGKGEDAQKWPTGGSRDVNGGDYFAFRDLEELWEHIRAVVAKYQASCPF